MRGWAVWNIEYRRIGDGGGWPETFADVAAAIDHLDGLHPALDLDRVELLGHSAGGHLALWAAGRETAAGRRAGRDRRGRRASPIAARDRAGRRLRPGRRLPRVARRRRAGADGRLARAAARALRDRRSDAPRAAGMPVLLVHGVLDETVSVSLSRNYARGGARGRRRGRARRDRGRGGRPPRAHRAARRRVGAGAALAGDDRGRGRALGCRATLSGVAASRVAASVRRRTSARARRAGARRSRRRPWRVGAAEVPRRAGDVEVHPRRLADEVRAGTSRRRSCRPCAPPGALSRSP